MINGADALDLAKSEGCDNAAFVRIVEPLVQQQMQDIDRENEEMGQQPHGWEPSI